jgi:nitronate monooxygenase
MSGRDIYAMLRAGASAAQLGTAFLPCLECTASSAHKRYILQEAPRETVLTTAFSGRPARGIQNSFMDRMDGARTLPFPLQNTLTSVLRAQAQRDDDGELQSLWVGSAYLQARNRIPAATGQKDGSSVKCGWYLSAGELVRQLHREYEDCARS